MSPSNAIDLVERPASKRADRTGMRRRLLFFVPIAALLVLGVAFGIGLSRDPSIIPSPLIGKPVPEFNLSAVQGRTLGLSSADLKGQVSLVNVFASWCVACRQEHPFFMDIKRTGIVPLHGLNYKDKPADAAAWLDRLGDPYIRTGADLDGRVSIDWGVYGVPETFVVDRDGRIAFKHIGPVNRQILEGTIFPLVERLRK